MKFFGYTGVSLFVDLSSGQIQEFNTPPELCEGFLGGRGFGVALLKDYIRYSPYDEEMPIVFASGPLVGTPVPTSGRGSIISRSPLTGTVFDCSVGGRFFTELKKAGYDICVIRGVSKGWVYIDIENRSARLRDASELSGMNTDEVLKALSDGGSLASIGRAGERLVRYASIIIDGHYAAGRGGLGAIMGAKRLKAIRVKGNKRIKIQNRQLLDEARAEIMRLLRASPAIFGEFGLSNYGTPTLVDLIHARRLEPTANFKESFFHGSGKYSGYRLKELYKTRKTGCRGCPILCKKKGQKGEVIPEYETVSHFGALNLNDDIHSIVKANRLCNEYGLDTISTAATIACYSEYIGRPLKPEEIVELVKAIGERRDTGDALAEGSRRFADSIGMPRISMTVKGLELPAYDPRGAYGMALAYATSNRGGCHLRAYPISYEILRKPVYVDRFSFEGKARMVKISEDMNAVVDSLTACKFVFFATTLEEYAKALNAVTGMTHNVQSLLSIGERIWLVERYLNQLNGFSGRDDTLPERFFQKEGYSNGRITVAPIDREAFQKALKRYYCVRGYSEEGLIEGTLLERLLSDLRKYTPFKGIPID
jgi:aldehyde:ferredoxin oxidoreductase